MLSAPQSVHFEAPAAEKVPFGHVCTGLLPSHREPAGHVLHVSRVLEVAPVVKLPRGHLRHASAWFASEYKLSAPQSVHSHAPLALYVPLGQVWIGLLPSQREPAGHVVHVSRVVEVAPVVYEPAAQV